MPAGDRTGPMGQGPMTGRALGFCAGFDSPGYVKGVGGGIGRGYGPGRGMGRGLRFRGGRGYGFRWGQNLGQPYAEFPPFPWHQAISRDDEIKMLKARIKSLDHMKKDIENRLGELESQNDQD